MCVSDTPSEHRARKLAPGDQACPGYMRIPSSHWGDLWERLGFPGNQMKLGCQGGERIHHVSGSSTGLPVGSLPALLQEEGHSPGKWWRVPPSEQRQRQALERPLGRGKRASCRT